MWEFKNFKNCKMRPHYEFCQNFKVNTGYFNNYQNDPKSYLKSSETSVI